ncbi:hypothetical protein [uncultured Enterovirga sp.]|uniref:hypothetical protein n=1 Tax=uncultured Enterovirga sp. TaxID=2026352 RepID=UPI0035CA066C
MEAEDRSEAGERGGWNRYVLDLMDSSRHFAARAGTRTARREDGRLATKADSPRLPAREEREPGFDEVEFAGRAHSGLLGWDRDELATLAGLRWSRNADRAVVRQTPVRAVCLLP